MPVKPAPDAPRTSVVDFLKKLRDQLRGHIEPEDFNAAVRLSRSHAGGLAKSRNAGDAKSAQSKESVVSESDSDDGDKKSSDDKTKSSENKTIELKIAAQEFAELTKTSVNYRTSDSDTRRCGTCSHYSSGGCGLVIGTISTSAVCDRYSRGQMTASDPLEEIAQQFAYDDYSSIRRVGLLPKMDDRIDYREASAPLETCGNCTFFMSGNRCCIVEGTIAAHCTCNMSNPQTVAMHEPDYDDQPCPDCGKKHKKTMSVVGEVPENQYFGEHRANFDPDLKLFFELQEYAEAPDWIPFLPTPGVYTHPRYGKITMSKQRSDRMIKNFADKIYQGHIPIDLEHALKTSGAAGYIQSFRSNDDGSVDAKIDWTDLGKDAIAKDRFRYFSPEFWDTWNHPTNGQKYNDVIVGGALTTRPFFKDSKFGGLRPLIASELIRASEGDDDMGMTEDETQRFNELFETVGSLNGKLELSETARTAAEARAQALETTVGAMTLAEQTRRFSDLSKDWTGDKVVNLSTLLNMSKAFGEESDEFRGYVNSMKSASEQSRQVSLFTEIGSSRSKPASFGSSVLDEINSLAKTYVESHPGMSTEVAQSHVFAENPELYDKYEGERQASVRAAAGTNGR